MQTRSIDEKAVRPSVRLYIKRIDCDKTGERSVQIFMNTFIRTKQHKKEQKNNIQPIAYIYIKQVVHQINS